MGVEVPGEAPRARDAREAERGHLYGTSSSPMRDGRLTVQVLRRLSTRMTSMHIVFWSRNAVATRALS
eukprot:7335158-Alexandrium_andersonii.AAC.1